jgi:hypothetical protein
MRIPKTWLFVAALASPFIYPAFIGAQQQINGNNIVDNTLPASKLVRMTSGQLLVGFTSNPVTARTVSGDGTLSAAGAITITKSNGTAFGTAAFDNTGSSGATIPLLNGLNIWSMPQTINLNSTSAPAAQTGSVLQAAQADSVTSRLEVDSFGALAAHSCVRSDGTNASPTAVLSGEEGCGINSFLYNGAAVVGPLASFRMYAAENQSSGHGGTTACLATTPIASTTESNHLCQANNGVVSVNLNAAAAPAPLASTVSQINGADSVGSGFESRSYGVAPTLTMMRADGTGASPSAVQTAESLASIGAIGYGATGYASANTGLMSIIAAENWSDTAHGTRIAWSVTADGTTTLTEAARIANNGDFLVATTADNNTDKLQVNGSGYVVAPLRSTGSPPTIASNACGSTTQGVVASGGNDNDFKVTVGTTSVSSCTISFANTWLTAPSACVTEAADILASAVTTTKPYISSISTTQMVISQGTGATVTLDSAAYYIHCG